MTLTQPLFESILVYAGIWCCFHLGSGYIAHRLPLHLIGSLTMICRTYQFEHNATVYHRFRIQVWKDQLPEAGASLPGGFSKRQLRERKESYLLRFQLETCRAEFSHWLSWLLALTFFTWTPWWIAIIMLVYGGITNLPFILIQRYNRARLNRVLTHFKSGCEQKSCAPSTSLYYAPSSGTGNEGIPRRKT